MSPTPKWLLRLRPYSETYVRMVQEINALLRAASDDELTQLLEDAGQVTNTNCWWATNRVAPIVRDELGDELERRRRLRQDEDGDREGDGRAEH